MRVNLWILYLLLLLQACSTGSVVRKSRITPAKKIQLHLQAGVGSNEIGGGLEEAFPAIPTFDVAFRYGVNSYLDLQLHMNSHLFTTLGVGLQLFRHEKASIAMSIDLGGLLFTGYGMDVSVMFFGGLRLHKKLHLELSVGYQPTFILAAFTTGEGLMQHGLRAGVGFEIELSKRLSLQPQFGAYIPLSSNKEPTTWSWNVGLGLNITL